MVFDKALTALAIIMSAAALALALFPFKTKEKGPDGATVANSIRLMDSYYERHKDDDCSYDMRHMRDILLDSLQ